MGEHFLKGELKAWVSCGVVVFGLVTGSGCGRLPEPVLPRVCAPSSLTAVTGSTGEGEVFLPDPMASSGDILLSPTSVRLDDYRSHVPLSRLGGEGVLKGEFVEVLNGLTCKDRHGAFDLNNQFSYSHQDWRFQEVMSYYFGDLYLSSLKKTSGLQFSPIVKIIAHCELNDNAYFGRNLATTGSEVRVVCLGDSAMTPGASYSDDGTVIVHELQHAATTDSYSLNQDLNQLWYDEAGALNEAISDFMAIAFMDSQIPRPFEFLDSRVFSRWALGTFDSKRSHARGVHKCPMYDSNFPNCGLYPSFSAPSPSNGNTSTISYVYPDGLGWAYPKNFRGANPVRQSFGRYTLQEEIHEAGTILSGSLWDAYTAVKGNHGGDGNSAFVILSQLVLESIRHLPMPNSASNHSPVNFIQFASQLVTDFKRIEGLSVTDQNLIRQALKDRGLYGAPTLDSASWMGVGTGTNALISQTSNPGIHVVDDAFVLKSWLYQMKKNASIIRSNLSTGLNSQLDPGEIVAIWFDIQNNSELTAGGVLVTVTSTDPAITIMDGTLNPGYLSQSGLNQAQVMYGKINGEGIVRTLNPPGSGDIPMDHSYFNTNLFFNQSWRTAVWIQVSPDAPHGKVVNLEVQASPSNGVTAMQNFPVVIH